MRIQDLTMGLHRCLAIVFVSFDTTTDPHQRTLEDRGHLVLPVRSLRTALESVRLYSFDLLVLGKGLTHEEKLMIIERAVAAHPRANILSLQDSSSGELPHTRAYVQSGDVAAFEFALDHFEHWQYNSGRSMVPQ